MEDQLNKIISKLNDITDQLSHIADPYTRWINLLSGIAVAVAAVAACYSAYQSKKTAEEVRKDRMDEFRPFISNAYHQSHGKNEKLKNVFCFSIKNTGKGPLHDLKALNLKNAISARTTLGKDVELQITIPDDNYETLANNKKIVLEYLDMFNRRFRSEVSVGVDLNENNPHKWIFSVREDFIQTEIH